MKILLTVLSLAALLLSFGVNSVSAQISHKSCGAMGVWNAGNSSHHATGEFTSTMATSGPGVIVEINEAAMAAYCVSK